MVSGKGGVTYLHRDTISPQGQKGVTNEDAIIARGGMSGEENPNPAEFLQRSTKKLPGMNSRKVAG